MRKKIRAVNSVDSPLILFSGEGVFHIDYQVSTYNRLPRMISHIGISTYSEIGKITYLKTGENQSIT